MTVGNRWGDGGGVKVTGRGCNGDTTMSRSAGFGETPKMLIRRGCCGEGFGWDVVRCVDTLYSHI